MSVRNYSNVTTVGNLSAPLASSAVTVGVTNFNATPATPFTATIDRNTATEEIVLVTGNAGGTLTITRGYDGTAAQAHSAGATIEHTAGAIDYAEANAHVNATTGVHGTTGGLVGVSGTQTIFDKTLVSPVAQADATAGDAVVAYVPAAASTRNLFRGVGTDGLDKITVDATGKITSAGTAITTQAQNATNAPTVNTVVKRDANGRAQVADPAVAADIATKNYADTKASIAGDLGGTAAVPTVTSGTHHTHTSAQVSDAVSAATASRVIIRDAAGRAQVADPAVAADIATMNYVDTATALVFGKMWGTTGISAGISTGTVTVAFNASRTQNGVTFATNRLTLNKDGFWELTYKGYANGSTGAVGWNVFRTRASVGDVLCDGIQFHKAATGSDEIATGTAIVPLKASDTLYLQMAIANAAGAISYVGNSEGQSVMVQARYVGPLNGATPI